MRSFVDDSLFPGHEARHHMPPRSCINCYMPGLPRQSSAYDHVHTNQQLPTAGGNPDVVITQGFAVNLDGGDVGQPETWMFFGEIDPALVFARAGLTSDDIRNVHVYRAAREVRHEGRQDVVYLYVHVGIALHGDADERAALARWAQAQGNRS